MSSLSFECKQRWPSFAPRDLKGRISAQECPSLVPWKNSGGWNQPLAFHVLRRASPSTRRPPPGWSAERSRSKPASSRTGPPHLSGVDPPARSVQSASAVSDAYSSACPAFAQSVVSRTRVSRSRLTGDSFDQWWRGGAAALDSPDCSSRALVPAPLLQSVGS